MYRIVYTKSTPFSMKDWNKESPVKIAAGADCVMAVTADGRALQKITSPENAARTEYWINIRDLALSKSVPGMAVGLVNDGTCMISKRPVRRLCGDDDEGKRRFDRINNEVRSWKNIVQVAVSDTFFALDSGGRVHFAPVFCGDDYKDALSWEGIVRIVPGNQNSLFGITAEGKIVSAGYNLTQGPHGDVRDALAGLTDVTDICALGSECEEIIYAAGDGTVRSLSGRVIAEGCAGCAPLMDSIPAAAIAETAKWKNTAAISIGCADGKAFAVGLSVK